MFLFLLQQKITFVIFSNLLFFFFFLLNQLSRAVSIFTLFFHSLFGQKKKTKKKREIDEYSRPITRRRNNKNLISLNHRTQKCFSSSRWFFFFHPRFALWAYICAYMYPRGIMYFTRVCCCRSIFQFFFYFFYNSRLWYFRLRRDGSFIRRPSSTKVITTISRHLVITKTICRWFL